MASGLTIPFLTSFFIIILLVYSKTAWCAGLKAKVTRRLCSTANGSAAETVPRGKFAHSTRVSSRGRTLITPEAVTSFDLFDLFLFFNGFLYIFILIYCILFIFFWICLLYRHRVFVYCTTGRSIRWFSKRCESRCCTDVFVICAYLCFLI